MATENYDILVQLHEKVLNKTLAMVFYKGMLKVEGNYELESSLPIEMKPYTTFGYEISLANEPFVDFRGEDTLFIRFSAILDLTVLSGIVLRFKVEFYVSSKIQFDFGNRKLYYELLDANILKIGIQSQYFVGNDFLSKLNFIIHEIIDTYFKNQIKQLEIPVALDGLTLPMMPAGNAYQLPLSKVDIKILNNKVLVVGISLFTNQGSMDGMTNLTNEKDCYIAIREQSILQVLDFWWTNTTYNKKQDFSEVIELGFASPLASGIDKVTRVISLGFIQTETDYDDLMLNYGGTVTLDKKPVINLKTDDKVEISNLEFIADVYANLFADVKKVINFDTSSFISDNITPWHDDINLKNIDENRKLLELINQFTIKINKAEGHLKINDKNNLAIKITDADFILTFTKKGTTFSDNTWNKIMDFLKRKVLDKIPEIIVSPSLILSDVNVYGFTFGLSEIYLNITDDKIEFATNLIINELKSNTVAVPNYIANRETKTVHLFNCKFVNDIDMEDRIGYYVMYEALAANFKACKTCLNSYKIL